MWSDYPGLLWYDYEEDVFFYIPLHPAGKDNAYSYPPRTLLPSPLAPTGAPRTPDYYPSVVGFIPQFLVGSPPLSQAPRLCLSHTKRCVPACSSVGVSPCTSDSSPFMDFAAS